MHVVPGLVLGFDERVCRGVELFVPFEEGESDDEHIFDGLPALFGDQFAGGFRRSSYELQ